MGFTVAMIGNEARPYAQTSEAQLIELGKERGVEVTIKCAACLLRRSPRLLAPALLPVPPPFPLPTTALRSLPLSVTCFGLCCPGCFRQLLSLLRRAHSAAPPR